MDWFLWSCAISHIILSYNSHISCLSFQLNLKESICRFIIVQSFPDLRRFHRCNIMETTSVKSFQGHRLKNKSALIVTMKVNIIFLISLILSNFHSYKLFSVFIFLLALSSFFFFLLPVIFPTPFSASNKHFTPLIIPITFPFSMHCSFKFSYFHSFFF